METVFTGAVTVVGDNIDTDQIYPGRFGVHRSQRNWNALSLRS